MVLESVLVSFFYKWFTVFPVPLVKEIVFSPLYILASFVKDKVRGFISGLSMSDSLLTKHTWQVWWLSLHD